MHNMFYWSAPDDYKGNLVRVSSALHALTVDLQLTSYNGYLKFFVYFVGTEGVEQAFRYADLVLEGNGIKLEYFANQPVTRQRENSSIVVSVVRKTQHKTSSRRYFSTKTTANTVVGSMRRRAIKSPSTNSCER